MSIHSIRDWHLFPFQAETSAKKEDRPKSPSFISKLLGGLKPKAEKKVKEKAPKKDKKEVCWFLHFRLLRWTDRVLSLQAPAPATEESAPPAEEPAADVKPEEAPAPEPVVDAAPVPAEPVKEAETPAPAEAEAPVPEATPEEPKKEEEKKEEKKEEKEEKGGRSPLKISRRLSARVGEFFKPRSKEVNHPVKVDEAPPKIEEPAPVAPLENPAADSTPATAEEPKKEETNEPPKIVEATPTPVVAAA